jgi:hypothetical protein
MPGSTWSETALDACFGSDPGGVRSDRIDEARAKSLEVRAAAADRHAAEVVGVIDQIQAVGISSLAGIAAELTRRQVPTSRGETTWQAVQVRRLLDRI